jgi:ubiquinone/menaquinone biosynthesis C-methylase UbiE
MVELAGKNVAKAGFSKEIEVRVGSVSHLPFTGESFDMVVSTGSLHHWKEPIGGLNEIYRVLKQGSYALLYDVVKDIPLPLLKKTAREFGMWRVMLFWFHGFEEPFWSQEDLASLARASLFRESQRSHFVSVLCCLVLRKD